VKLIRCNLTFFSPPELYTFKYMQRVWFFSFPQTFKSAKSLSSARRTVRFISHKFGARLVRRLSNTNLMAYYKHFANIIWYSDRELRMRKLLGPSATPQKKTNGPPRRDYFGRTSPPVWYYGAVAPRIGPRNLESNARASR